MMGSSDSTFVSFFLGWIGLKPPAVLRGSNQRNEQPTTQEGTTSTSTWLRTPGIRWSDYGPRVAHEDVVKTCDFDDNNKGREKKRDDRPGMNFWRGEFLDVFFVFMLLGYSLGFNM